MKMIYVCFVVFYMNAVGYKAQQTAAETPVKGYKRAMGNENAFDTDFDRCMINQWMAAGPNRGPVLRTSPTAACTTPDHSRLCYGTQGNAAPAQFISCYNTEKLIPEFTAYIVQTGAYNSRVQGKYNRPGFRQEEGTHAPNPQAHTDNYKNPNPQGNNQNYCNRGHLVPCGQFNNKNERDLTFIMTNVAPQWLPFNSGNWAVVERAVKKYAEAAGHGVYVFTGTAGIAKRRTILLLSPQPNEPVAKKPKTTGELVVPKYFWKAVCDPIIKKSIAFIAENNVGVTSQEKVTKGACTTQVKGMTMERGVVYCYDVSRAHDLYFRHWWPGVSLPDFHPDNCGTAEMGKFLDDYLKKNWQ